MALLAALLVSGVGLVLADLAVDSGKALLRQQAIAQLDAGVAVFGFGGAPPPGVVVDPERLPGALVRAVTSDSAPNGVTWDDGTVMWAARSAQPSGIIATSVANAPLLTQATRINTVLLVTVGAAALLAALVAWVIADRLTARLRAAAASVNATIAGQDLPQPAGGDEVAVMTGALGTTAQRLATRLRREQAFTADVAHDLRTPLTALVSAAELLEDTPSAELVRRQVTRMRLLVEDLLELARANQLDTATLRTIALSAVIRDALDDLGPAPDCSLTVLHDGVVHADPVRLRSAISNLLQNAHKHGQPPIEIVLDNTSISVTDHGHGYPDALLREGPRRFRAAGNSAGSGLGLAIVLEHVQAVGATLTLANMPGAVARIEFEPSPTVKPAARADSERPNGDLTPTT